MSTPFYTRSGAAKLAAQPQYGIDEARETITDIIARLEALADSTGGGMGLMYRGRAKGLRQRLIDLDRSYTERERLIIAGVIRQNLEILEAAP